MPSSPATTGLDQLSALHRASGGRYERRDREGRAYTDIREVPLQTADPQLHTHVTMFNSVLTDSGHIGAVDLDRLAGRVKGLGAVYHANVAARARRLGIETVLDERTGAARLAAIPHRCACCSASGRSKRRRRRATSRQRGASTGTRSPPSRKIALLKAGRPKPGRQKQRRQKAWKPKSDFAVWHDQAAAASIAIAACCGRIRSRPHPCGTAPRGGLFRGSAIARRGAGPPCGIGRPGIVRDRGAGIDRRRYRQAPRRRHRRRDQKFLERGVVQDGPTGGIAVGQGGTPARQGALERHDGAAYRPGTRADPAGQDRLARFVGGFAGSTSRPRSPMPSSRATR